MEYATPAQISYITDLVNKKVVTPKWEPVIKNIQTGRASKRDASVTISWLKEQPNKVQMVSTPAFGAVETALKDLPKSKYALRFEDLRYFLPDVNPNGNDMLFAEIKEYKGRTYIRRLHGASGDFTRTRLNTESSIALANLIRLDPAGAAKLFGEVHKCCAVCAAPLTDEISRSLSLGPVCRQRFGL